MTVTPLKVVTGIPSPYAIAACPTPPALGTGAKVLVTSPSDDFVRVLDVSQGSIVGKVPVGPQAYSAVCLGQGFVSSLGANTLTIFDLNTLTVTATIPGVPGSRGLHGIAITSNSTGVPVSTYRAWLASTDANALTVVDLFTFKALTEIPVPSPTAVLGDNAVCVASAGANNISCYDSYTAQLLTGAEWGQNVPNPQDFIGTALGTFATIGGQDAVYWINSAFAGPPTSTILGIPGAAGLAFLSPNTTNALVLVTSTSSNSLFIIQKQSSFPSQIGLSNAASFVTTQQAPGSLASAFGSIGVTQSFFSSGLPLPITLGGVSLSIGGTLNFNAASGWGYSSTSAVQAPLLFVGPQQINFQIPPGVAPTSAVPAQLTKPDGTTLLTTLNLTATAPGIFTIFQNGQGQAAVLNQDYSHNGDPQAMVGAKLAARGSVIQIFATGAGATSPALDAGQAAAASGTPLVTTQLQPTVAIGGKNAVVQFSGMAPGFVGLWQINAVVPADVTPGNAVPLYVSMGGNISNTVTIAVQ